MARGILRAEDLTGRQFKDWHVLSRAPRPHTRTTAAYWSCRCVCGVERVVLGVNLRKGESTGCGCGRPERVRKQATKHGMSATSTYGIYRGIHQRCYNENNDKYKDYGGRGIAVCGRWTGPNGFTNFLADMGERPSRDHTLDRKDNDGPYSPGNCHWATREEQHRNRRDTVRLVVDGKDVCATDVARMCGVHQNSVVRCMKHGLSGDEIVAKYHDRPNSSSSIPESHTAHSPSSFPDTPSFCAAPVPTPFPFSATASCKPPVPSSPPGSRGTSAESSGRSLCLPDSFSTGASVRACGPCCTPANRSMCSGNASAPRTPSDKSHTAFSSRASFAAIVAGTEKARSRSHANAPLPSPVTSGHD